MTTATGGTDARGRSPLDAQERGYRWGPVQELIFLDRYSPKGPREEIGVGDVVVVMTSDDPKRPAKEVGVVRAVDGDELTIELRHTGEVIRRHRRLCDRPLELRPEQMWDRMASAIVQVEPAHKREALRSEFRWLLDGFRFVPGGRINAMLGTGQKLTAYNCYTIPLQGRSEGVPADSRHGIIDTLGNMVEIMARGGGVGINLSVLRPRLAYVKGVNGKSSGSVSWGALFSFATGLVEQGGCFGPQTRIATDKGLVPVAELVYRLEQGEFIRAWTHRGLRPFTAAFRNGIKPLFRVRTRRGLSVDITADHKVAVLRQGSLTTVPLRELRVGDEILTLLSRGAQGEYLSLVPPVHRAVAPGRGPVEAVHFPRRLTEQLAYFVGYLHGELGVHADNPREPGRYGHESGAVAASGISLGVPPSKPSVKDALVEAVRALFGVEPEIELGGGPLLRIRVRSGLIPEWLHQNDLFSPNGEEPRVPEAIFRSPTSVMAAFIAGCFDAAGSGGDGGSEPWIDSTSRGMLQDLQLLLAYNGVASRIEDSCRARPCPYRLVVAEPASAARFVRLVGSCRGDATPREAGRTQVPAPFVPMVTVEAGAGGSSRALAVAQGHEVYGGLLSEAERLDGEPRVLPDTIVAIEPMGPSEVYDFEVEDVHLLSGNGVYTSNSRRGALMLILNVWHPDIIEFINSKRDFKAITNANISVGITDEFEQALAVDGDWELVFPDTADPDYDRVWDGDLKRWKALGKRVIVYRKLKARELWRQIVEAAWASAEPGIVRLDYANRMSNSWYFAPLIATNPCGEQPLPAWGVCLLGHLNLAKFVEDGRVNWDDLGRAARLGVRFLDNVIDITPYFFEANERQQKLERRVGMGTMGLAEMLIRLGLRYGSPEAVEFVDKLYAFIAREAYLGSVELAREKGPFPAFNAEKFLMSGFMRSMPEDVREAVRQHGIRNVTLLTQAPTGTTGTMVGTSTGIEPYYAWSYWRQGRLGRKEIVEPVVEEWFARHPEAERDYSKLPPYFVTALELTPEEHIRMQAAVQRWVDAALSKTANLPAHYTVEETMALYDLALKLGCKGVTVYRDRSRDEQVLMAKETPAAGKGSAASEASSAGSASAGKIPQERQGLSLGAPAPEPQEGLRVEPKAVIGEVPEEVRGFTYRQKTMVGTARVVVNEYPEGQPFETIIILGKGGMDITADAEAIGRLISLYLRTPSPISNLDKLALVVEQLRHIGGAQPFGFGPNKVLSMPDALAKALERYLTTRRSAGGTTGQGPSGSAGQGVEPGRAPSSAAGAPPGGETDGGRDETRAPSPGPVRLPPEEPSEPGKGAYSLPQGEASEETRPHGSLQGSTRQVPVGPPPGVSVGTGEERPLSAAGAAPDPGRAKATNNGHKVVMAGADICPVCGQAQYVRIEGCGFCHNCGYTRC